MESHASSTFNVYRYLIIGIYDPDMRTSMRRNILHPSKHSDSSHNAANDNRSERINYNDIVYASVGGATFLLALVFSALVLGFLYFTRR